MLDQIAHFTILGKLGQGGMGVVFKAQDTKLRRQVALKLLPSEHLGDAERQARFLREARSAAAVTHPNIATIYEIGTDEHGRVFIAMELVAGRSLRAELASRTRFEPAEALRITREIARGLAKAHEVGLVHRDIKPDNVMLTPDGDVKVLDFGLAKGQATESALEAAVTGGLDPTVSAAGVVVGTAGYMSPEQATGKAVDARSDVFSLGVVLYEMLSGELPFEGATFGELLVAVARDEARPLPDGLVAPALETLVMRCLAKEPAARPASARELVEALDGTSLTNRSDVAFARTERVQISDPPPAARRRRSPTRFVILGVAGVVAASVALYVAVLRKPVAAVVLADAGADAGVGLLALPTPACKEAAAREYRLGLEVSRGRGMELGQPFFERAIEADPSCAEAHLRAALYSQWGPAAVKHYNQASVLHDQLSARDRAIVDAYEPVFAKEPPDYDKAYARLFALGKAYPNDAEVLVLVCFMLWAVDPHQELASYAQRVIAIDRGFSAGWQMLGTALHRDGDYDGARRAFDDCAKAVPASVDCVAGQVKLAQWVGRCSDMESDARSLIARTGEKDAYGALADALASAGGPRESISEALSQYVMTRPDRAFAGKLEEARLAVLFGDFEQAESLLEEAERALEGSQDRTKHAARVQLAFELYLETQRTAAALKAAEGFASRNRAWSGPVDEYFGSEQEGMLLVPRMLGVQQRTGKITAAKREAGLLTWYEQNITLKESRTHWLVTRASWVETADEAKLAVAARPKQDADFRVAPLRALPNTVEAHVLALGGQLDEGITALKQVTARCEALDAPVTHTQAHLWLGEALEQKGATEEACKAYGVVLQRWRDSRPPSRSATLAARRVKALGCL